MLKLFGIQIWKLYKDIKKEIDEIKSSIKSLCYSFLWETASLLFGILKNVFELCSGILKFIGRGFNGCNKK